MEAGKAPAQTAITFQETSLPVETPAPPPPKKLTVKEQIDKLVDSSVNTDDIDIPKLKKSIFNLVQKILHPEQFCPTCDERMFFDVTSSAYTCANCGYQAKIVNAVPARPATPTTPTAPGTRPSSAGVPSQVENIISQANENMKETPIPRPKALGSKIQELVNKRDGVGSGAPTKEDEMRIKNSDKNTSSQINWC